MACKSLVINMLRSHMRVGYVNVSLSENHHNRIAGEIPYSGHCQLNTERVYCGQTNTGKIFEKKVVTFSSHLQDKARRIARRTG